MKARISFMAALAMACGVQATDSRIVTETYSADRVYSVPTRVGRATLIQFEADEVLSTSSGVLGLGDSDAWDLGVRSNSIILKPKAKLPDTNVLVVTNKRTYSFDLVTAGRARPPTYVLRFTYPDTDAAKAAEAAKQAALTAKAKATPIAINTDYVWRGKTPALKPTAAYDDGRFTHLVYDHAGEVPVFYKVLVDGTEAQIDSHVEGDTVVLHEVIRTARARLGDTVIEIINRGYTVPAFNTTGAGAAGAVRVEKGS